MNGYVEGGYLVAIGTISTYALTLLRRERIVRRRLQVGAPRASGEDDKPASPATSEPL